MERNGKTSLLLRTERNENGEIKKEQERNNLAEGPHSRMKRNNFEIIGMCPALPGAQCDIACWTRYFDCRLNVNNNNNPLSEN